MNELSEIKFPVLRFSQPEFGMLPYKSINEFQSTSISGLKILRSLSDDFLVDMTGKKYLLSKPGFVNPPKGISKILGTVMGRLYKLKWYVQFDEIIEPKELKKMISSEIELNISYWQAFDLGLLENTISRSSSVNEIIKAFFE